MSSTARNAVLSGVSNISERDRAHLRQISDTTVSSFGYGGGGNGEGGAGNGGGGGGRERVSALSVNNGVGIVGGEPVVDRGIVESPGAVSPPTASGEGFEFLGLGAAARAQQSPLRRSVFQEDINGDGEVGGGGSGSGSSPRRG